MSQKKYCPHCGKPNEYINGVAPEVCKSCNKPFAAAFKAAAPAASPAIKPRLSKKALARLEALQSEEEDLEDEEFTGEIIVPKRFEYKVSVPKRMTIGGLSEGGQVPDGVNPLQSNSFE